MRTQPIPGQPAFTTELLRTGDHATKDAYTQIRESFGMGYAVQTMTGRKVGIALDESTGQLKYHDGKAWKPISSQSQAASGETSRILTGNNSNLIQEPTTFNGGITLPTLTASRLAATDAAKGLTSVADLSAWIAGTANRVTVASDGDGSVTLSAPQDIHTGASPQFAGLTLTGDITSATTLNITSALHFSLLAGDGSAAANGSVGGLYRAIAGAGGNSTSTFSWNKGGAGGNADIQGGEGGSATVVGSAGGGKGGSFGMLGGNGGNSTNGTAGNGGDITIATGARGTASGTGTDGTDGIMYLRTGADTVITLKDGKMGILDTTPSYELDVTGDINATGVIRVDGTQVLANQQAHIADAKTDYTAGDLDSEAEVITAINATNTKINGILAMLETHGLTAAAA
jgi:hypothetical protein